MEAMEPPGVLDQSSFPRNRHRQKQRVEPSVIETLADIPASGKQKAFFAIRDLS